MTCAHLAGLHPVASAHPRRLRGVPEERHAVGSPAAVPGLRPRGLLRQLARPPRHPPLQDRRAPGHRVLRARRAVGLVLRGRGRPRRARGGRALLEIGRDAHRGVPRIGVDDLGPRAEGPRGERGLHVARAQDHQREPAVHGLAPVVRGVGAAEAARAPGRLAARRGTPSARGCRRARTRGIRRIGTARRARPRARRHSAIARSGTPACRA